MTIPVPVPLTGPVDIPEIKAAFPTYAYNDFRDYEGVFWYKPSTGETGRFPNSNINDNDFRGKREIIIVHIPLNSYNVDAKTILQSLKFMGPSIGYYALSGGTTNVYVPNQNAIKFIVDPGVIVGSHNAANPAFNVDGFGSGDVLFLQNLGTIEGAGGQGGAHGAAGQAGGTALYLNFPVSVDNSSGKLIGGGGGGGGGQDGHTYGSCLGGGSPTYGGPGGGGAGRDPGLPGPSDNVVTTYVPLGTAPLKGSLGNRAPLDSPTGNFSGFYILGTDNSSSAYPNGPYQGYTPQWYWIIDSGVLQYSAATPPTEGHYSFGTYRGYTTYRNGVAATTGPSTQSGCDPLLLDNSGLIDGVGRTGVYMFDMWGYGSTNATRNTYAVQTTIGIWRYNGQDVANNLYPQGSLVNTVTGNLTYQQHPNYQPWIQYNGGHVTVREYSWLVPGPPVPAVPGLYISAFDLDNIVTIAGGGATAGTATTGGVGGTGDPGTGGNGGALGRPGTGGVGGGRAGYTIQQARYVSNGVRTIGGVQTGTYAI